MFTYDIVVDDQVKLFFRILVLRISLSMLRGKATVTCNREEHLTTHDIFLKKYLCALKEAYILFI